MDGSYNCENLCIVWNDERKIRMREKQLELEDWMRMYGCDICAINETGLNGDEYVKVSTLYIWVGTNRDSSKGKYGEAGFIVKYDIRYEQVMCDCEDICFIKIVRVDGKFE